MKLKHLLYISVLIASQLLGAEKVKPLPSPAPMNEPLVNPIPRPILFYCKKHGFIGRDVVPVAQDSIYCGVCFREALDKLKIEKVKEVR